MAKTPTATAAAGTPPPTSNTLSAAGLAVRVLTVAVLAWGFRYSITPSHLPPSSSSSSSIAAPCDGYEGIDGGIRWLRDNGGVFRNIDVFQGPFGRGLVATDDLTTGITEEGGSWKAFDNDMRVPTAAVISVPNHMIINERSVRSSAIVQALDDMTELGISDSFLVSMVLEYERNNPRSMWGPYLRELGPIETPFKWTPEELAEIQSEFLVGELNTEKQHMVDLFDKAFPVLFKKHPRLFNENVNTLESWVNSVTQVWARSFSVRSGQTVNGEDEYVWGMVPIADLVNHQSGTENNYHQDTASFYIVPGKDYKKGDELKISYGDKNSVEFFTYYGFIPDDSEYGGRPNPLDFISIQMAETDTSALQELVVAKMADHKIQNVLSVARGKRWGAKAGAKTVFDVPAMLVAVVVDIVHELQLPAEGTSALWSPVASTELPPVADALSKACQILLHLVSAGVRDYATSLTEDEALLATPLPSRKWAAVKLRATQKRAFAELAGSIQRIASSLAQGAGPEKFSSYFAEKKTYPTLPEEVLTKPIASVEIKIDTEALELAGVQCLNPTWCDKGRMRAKIERALPDDGGLDKLGTVPGEMTDTLHMQELDGGNEQSESESEIESDETPA